MSRSVNPKRVPLWSRPMARDKRCGRQGHQDRGDRGQYAPRLWPVWPVAISAVVVAGALAGGIYPRATGTCCVTSWTQRWASFYRPARHYQDHDHRPGSSASSSSASTATASVDSSRETHAESTPSNSPSGTRQPPTSLGHEKPAVRLGGVYAMARLADNWDEQRRVCIDVLCAYPAHALRNCPCQREISRRRARSSSHHHPHRSRSSPRSQRPYHMGMVVILTSRTPRSTVATSPARSSPTVRCPSAARSLPRARLPSATLNSPVARSPSRMRSSPAVKSFFEGTKFAGGKVYFFGAEFTGGDVGFSKQDSPAVRSLSPARTSPAARSASSVRNSPVARSPSRMRRSPAANSPSTVRNTPPVAVSHGVHSSLRQPGLRYRRGIGNRTNRFCKSAVTPVFRLGSCGA
jgi:hypothetical protein